MVLSVLSGVLGYLMIKEQKGNRGGNEIPDVPNNTQNYEMMHSGEFEVDIFKESYLASLSDDVSNTVISPLSIKMAMAMVTEGAREDTLDELRGVLSLDENSKAYYKDLLENILEQDDITLNIANSVWSREGYSFQSDFLNLLEEYYCAQAESLDFEEPKSVEIINNWVKEKTNGKIDSILDKINPQDIMFLINAIYFNADWTKQFNEELTEEKDFTLLDGTKIKTDLMSMDSDFKYQENEEFQSVELPYGEYGRYVMRVYLPKEGIDIKDFVNGLTLEELKQWDQDFSWMEGSLELPKFTTRYEKSLVDILKNLGIVKAFDIGDANFKGIYESAFIGDVIHKTYIDVSERGTEAAAVTIIKMLASISMPTEPPERFEMIVDRPFFFTINDTDLDEIIFMGTILNPAE